MPPNPIDEIVSANLEQNERLLRQIFTNCSDVIYRPITFNGKIQILLLFIDGLVDAKHLDDMILKPLLFQEPSINSDNLDGLGQLLQNQSVPIGETKIVSKIQDVVRKVLKGEVVLFVDGEASALVASIKGWSKRGIEEPSTEQVIRGPREGFIETLRVNTSLIRRKIQSERLKMEPLTIGGLTQTDVVILYIEGTVNDNVLQEVRKRLDRIQIDGILETGYLEEFIEDAPFSPFPTVQNTERPDVVAANLLEGKVAIVADGTPFALIVPMTFWSALQANEDYYERAIFATAIRWIRYTFILTSLLLPSLYVALITFQREMLPTTFLLTVAAAQDATPFPAVVEAFLMEFMFEALREAGVRLPKAVGSAVSIVGALVIGQAAVQAGIVSAPMVIVVATTGIASFTVPRFNLGTALRLLRFPLLFLAGTLGTFGISIGLIAILLHLASLRSFGIPYLTPIAPFNRDSFQDVFVRVPWWNKQHHTEDGNP